MHVVIINCHCAFFNYLFLIYDKLQLLIIHLLGVLLIYVWLVICLYMYFYLRMRSHWQLVLLCSQYRFVNFHHKCYSPCADKLNSNKKNIRFSLEFSRRSLWSCLDYLLLYAAPLLLLSSDESLTANVHLLNCPDRHLSVVPPAQGWFTNPEP